MFVLPHSKKTAIVIGLIVLIAAFSLSTLIIKLATDASGQDLQATTRTVSQNGLTIGATLLPFSYGEQVKIDVSMNTHSGSLSLNLTNITTLRDNMGATYVPTNWSGSTPNGHHVSGTLFFPPLSDNPSSITLALTSVYGANWVFEWTLPK